MEKKALKNYSLNSSSDNKRLYLATLEHKLKTDISTTTKNSILLKKASTLTSPRSKDIEILQTESKEVYEIYNYLFSQENEDLYFRDAAILGYLRIFTQRGFHPFFISTLPKELQDIYDNYQKIYEGTLSKDLYNTYYKEPPGVPTSKERIPAMLTYNDIARLISDKNKNDISLITSSIINKTSLLRNLGVKLKDNEKDILVDELGKELESLKTGTPIFYTVYSATVLEPLLAETIGYDVYASYSTQTISEKTNEEIDRKYSASLDSLTADSSPDKISIKYIDAYVSIWYLDSLHRRYGDKIDKKKENELVNRVVADITSSQDLNNVFSENFKTIINYGKTWERPTTHFVSLAKNYTALKQYLISVGVDESLIK